MSEEVFMCVRIQAKPNKVSELHKRLLEMVNKTSQESGNIFYNLHIDLHDPTIFYFMEGWRDQEALDFHDATPYVRAILEAAPVLSENGFRVELMRRIT